MTRRRTQSAPGPSAPAFTLLELAVVVVILVILAATAAPALSTLAGARRAAARDEVERLFVEARARAMAGAGPAGVMVWPATSTLQLQDRPSGQAPRQAPDPTGQPTPALVLPDRFGGTQVQSWVGPDGGSSAQAVWFSHAGRPQRRNASGGLVGDAASDATLVLTGGLQVVVRRVSGAVE